MHILREASEAEVILEWLRAEINSSRFQEGVKKALAEIGADADIIRNPTLGDAVEDVQRRAILKLSRGDDDHLLTGFPTDIAWSLVELDEHEVRQVQYINAKDWLEVSGGTRLAADAARRIERRLTWYATLWDSIPAAEIASNRSLPRLIIVTDGDESRLVLLEGHLRFTSFHVAGLVPERLAVFLGTSSDMRSWPLF